MTNYLISTKKGIEHYFYRPYEGICMKRRLAGGIWQEHKSVLKSGRDTFGVYADDREQVHLICTDAENRLIYAIRKNDVWKKFILSGLNRDVFICDMRIYSVNGRLNLLYSALYNGETLLVHCILGDHAKPEAVAALESSHFFIYNQKVFFTDTSGRLGYVLLSDEKPSGFYFLYDDAHFGTLSSLGGKELIIFTRDSRLFINGEEILYDSRMENPVFVKGADRAYIMWKSGSFVRYIATFNGGITWSEPMRFMSTSATPSLYIAQWKDTFNLYYGYQSEKDVTLLGAPDIFSESRNFSYTDELERLKTTLGTSMRELAEARAEVARLNKIISEKKL